MPAEECGALYFTLSTSQTPSTMVNFENQRVSFRWRKQHKQLIPSAFLSLFNGKLHYFPPSASSRCTRLSVVICFRLGSSQDRVTARTSNPENRSLIIFQNITTRVQKARGTFKIPRHNPRAPLESKLCN